MKASCAFKIGGGIAAVAAVAIGSRLHRHWGATPAEQATALPGDDLVADPKFRSTRGITIDAAPQAIWPWLVQMGMGRAGWYSYDRFLSVWSQLGTQSAAKIIEDFQDLRVGDPVDLIDSMVFKVNEIIPEEALVLYADEYQRPLQPWVKSWVFALRPLPGGATRLLVREISNWDSPLVGAVTSLTAWAWFAVARRQLKNLKALVEAT
jgi:hypothetical protein